MYEKLSSMTGTADTESFEFQKIYNLKWWYSTNKEMVRQDFPIKFMTQEEKFDAVLRK
jgi:preprotein translocase subunit SecA